MRHIEARDIYDFSHVAPRRFITLDAMRGVAAITVMLFHYFVGTSYHIFAHGFYAVDFFFVLSGVVLTHSYAMKIRGQMPFAQYITARIIRLYPLYIVGTMLGASLLPFYMWHSITGVTLSWKHYILSLISAALFLPFPTRDAVPFLHGGTVNGVLFPDDIPAWSLFFEMLGSIALFVVIRKRVKPQYLVAASLPFLVGVLLVYKMANIGWTIDTFAGGFPRMAFGFSLGVLIYWLLAVSAYTKCPISPIWLLATTLAMFAAPISGIGPLILFVLIPGLIYAGLSVPTAEEQLPIFAWLGRISYAIYVIHLPVYHLFILILTSADSGYRIRNAPFLLACISTATVIVLAHFLTACIDEPLRRALNKLSSLGSATSTHAVSG
jgi:peptidoglycan/LPS O-acetylase OafA/YrhL